MVYTENTLQYDHERKRGQIPKNSRWFCSSSVYIEPFRAASQVRGSGRQICLFWNPLIIRQSYYPVFSWTARKCLPFSKKQWASIFFPFRLMKIRKFANNSQNWCRHKETYTVGESKILEIIFDYSHQDF